jgi:hypothetical protein
MLKDKTLGQLAENAYLDARFTLGASHKNAWDAAAAVVEREVLHKVKLKEDAKTNAWAAARKAGGAKGTV